MTVKDLKKLLEKVDGELEVVVGLGDQDEDVADIKKCQLITTEEESYFKIDVDIDSDYEDEEE